MKILTILLALAGTSFIIVAPAKASKFRRVCYYYQLDNNSFPPEKLDYTLCTHIIFDGVSYDAVNGTLVYHDPSRDVPLAAKILAAKRTAGFKFMVCHGWGQGVDPNIVGSPEKLAAFTNVVVKFLKQNGYDGLDLDWEYPMLGNRTAFSTVLRALRSAFDAESPRLILSLATGAIKLFVEESYEVPVLAQTLDSLNIMGYGYRAWSDNYLLTANHQPLFASKYDISYLASLNLNWSANYFASNGVPRDKIALGLGAYSIGWTLLISELNGIMAPAKGTANPEEQSQADVCAFMQKNGTKSAWDNDAKAPHSYNGLNWYSYDDVNSIAAKVNYTISNGFGGIMIWSLLCDADFNRVCTRSGFPPSDFPVHALIAKLLP